MVAVSFDGSKKSRIATTRQGVGGSCYQIPQTPPAFRGRQGSVERGPLEGARRTISSSLIIARSGCVFTNKRYLAQAIEENGVELWRETQRGMIPGTC